MGLGRPLKMNAFMLATYIGKVYLTSSHRLIGGPTRMKNATKTTRRSALRSLRELWNQVAILSLRLRGVDLPKGTRVYGRLCFTCAKGSRIEIAENVIFNSLVTRNTLEARGPNIIKLLTQSAKLGIGKDTGITSSTISVAHRVCIGERVLIGGGVLITDSDHHIVSPSRVEDRRRAPFPISSEDDAIVIEDDVFIGARSIILKGVTIGKGSVIGAASVVTKSIPPGVIAAGNPCSFVRALDVDRS